MAAVFNQIAWFPAVALLLVYGYVAFAYLLGDYEGPIFHTDPKRFGIVSGFYLVTRWLVGPLVVSALPAVLLVLISIPCRFFAALSWKSGTALLLALCLIIVLHRFDPGGYLFWYFD